MSNEVAQWQVIELEFASDKSYDNPTADIQLSVEFTAIDGTRYKSAAFWDGDDIWRVRFSPESVGKWAVAIDLQ